MVGMDAISALLETGSWRTSRSKSQNPYSRTPRRTDPLSELDIHVDKPSETRRRIPRLPPPTVEDETESLAKEHGSPSVISSYEDEPPNRGEVDQEILMEPVLENNPERRFVVVTGPGAGKEGEPAPSIVATTPSNPEKEETNDCKKFVLVPSDETNDGDKQKEKKVSELGKRKSHQDLPRLDTHVQEPGIKDVFIEPPKDRRSPEKTPVYQEDDRAARIKRSSSRRRPEAYADEEDAKKASLKRASSRRRPEVPPDDQDSADTSIKRSSSRRYRERPVDHDAKDSPIKRSSSRKPRNRPLHDSEITADSPDNVNPGASDFPASVVTEMAGGRERAYYDLNQAADGLSHRRSKSKHGARITPSNSRQAYHLSPPQTPGRPRHDRVASTPDVPRIDSRSLELEGPGIAPLSMYRYNEADDAMAFMVQEDAILDHDLTRKSPPPRKNRKESPPPYPSGAERKRMPSQAATNRRRRNSMAAPRDRREYPIDDDPRYHHLDHQEQPQPFRPVVEEDASLMALRHRLGAVDMGSESQDMVPHPSALALRQQDQFSEPSDPGSSRSATFSAEGDYRRGRAGTYSSTSSPPNGRLAPRREDEGNPRTRRRARSRTMGTNPYSNSSPILHEFVATSLRPDKHVVCDIGSSFWYRMAYLMTLKQRLPDLQLVRNVAAISGLNPPCSGPQEKSRIWHGMWDPYKREYVPHFEVCVGCAKMLEAVLPNLVNTLYPMSLEPFTAYCQLHYAPGRKRFMDYWDLLETTSDIALSHQTEPDIRVLASGLRRIARVKECPPCPQDQALVNAYWHVMQFLPDFTVCEECYREVVKPMLDANDTRSDIPWNFLPDRLVSKPIASCHLSSERMREEFREACRLNDYGYLEGKYIERMGTPVTPVSRW
ncbi:unnamed protein product [Sordaria macrospora k-hell]|uniref:WGS project CABT00000000 data, contig 2.11 n=1 Tax=Sordaria macrospora (strain ATCC MYA-333 / DSM 997 / K(L3346) / K-hell) TaxID=771870 RepID=F7VWY7_SORMK|nr:uncharacterized protein SMAC_02608 [Sordaria macrospora k-hell]CCC10028.1 unnamed protein product [Sordaria macrospora k-hell]